MLTMDEIRQKSKENFYFLIGKAFFHKADISKLLSTPNKMGDTAFMMAYHEIGDDLLIETMKKYNVEINFVNLNFDTIKPHPEHAMAFAMKGLNLKIINRLGDSSLKDLNRFNEQYSKSFSTAMQRLIDILPNAAYFCPVEQKCIKTCPVKGFFNSMLFRIVHKEMFESLFKIFVNQK